MHAGGVGRGEGNHSHRQWVPFPRSACVARPTELRAGGESVVAAGFGYAVLANLVEQCLVADL